MAVPPLAVLCVAALARAPDQLGHARHVRVPASPALLDAGDTRDPRLWAVLAQLVHPLPTRLHDLDLALDHPDLGLLQKIPDSPDFSLVTLVALPNCTHLRDRDVAALRSLGRLLALDLRGCPITSYALVALARGLAPPSDDDDDDPGTGTWGLRLLSLHGCPNLDDGVLPALAKFPLLSAVDLRFTRCTPSAVRASLEPLGFRPSDKSPLFHPAPLSLALCALDKIALAAPRPVSLYSCPPHAVFRVHVGQPSVPKKPPLARASNPTTSFARDTVVFVPKPAQDDSGPPSPVSTNQPTRSGLGCSVSSFYEHTPTSSTHPRKSILPWSAQAVQSSEDAKSDPLAIARLPPPWAALDANKASRTPPTLWNASSDDAGNPRVRPPVAHRTGRTLNDPLNVDRTRLHRRASDAVSDLAHQFATKRPKVESEFVQTRTRANVSVVPRNPFASSARSAFVQNTPNTHEQRLPVDGPSKEAESDMQLRVSRSLPSKTAQRQGTVPEGTVKSLKPITTLKPPILPKELFPRSLRSDSKPKAALKQARLTFARKGRQNTDDCGD